MNDLLTKFGGKKICALMAYMLLMLFKDKVGIGPDEVEKISYTIMSYLGAQGVADGLSKGKTSHTK